MGQRLKPAGRDISRPCTRSWARLNLDAADEAAGGDVEDRQFLTVRARKAEQDAVAFDVGAFEALARGGHGRAIRRAAPSRRPAPRNAPAISAPTAIMQSAPRKMTRASAPR